MDPTPTAKSDSSNSPRSIREEGTRVRTHAPTDEVRPTTAESQPSHTMSTRSTSREKSDSSESKAPKAKYPRNPETKMMSRSWLEKVMRAPSIMPETTPAGASPFPAGLTRSRQSRANRKVTAMTAAMNR